MRSIQEERRLFYGALENMALINGEVRKVYDDPELSKGCHYEQLRNGKVHIICHTGISRGAFTSTKSQLTGEAKEWFLKKHGKHPDEKEKGGGAWVGKLLEGLIPAVAKGLTPTAQAAPSPTTYVPSAPSAPETTKSPWPVIAVVGGVVLVLGVTVWAVTR